MLILLFAVSGFAANLGGRYFDPLVTMIARDFGVATATAALLSSAFALPFSIGQPFLGPLGDSFGKPLVFKICMWLVALGLLAAAVSSSLGALFVSRAVTGLAAGGTIPLALAMIGDIVPLGQRQVALARFSAGAIIGQLVGLTVAGAIAAETGWRPSLWVPAVIAVLVAALATVRVPNGIGGPRAAFSPADMIGRYRLVFANPSTPICYAAVFAEGVSVYGLIPFIAEILEGRHAGGPREAGLVIAGLGLGCIVLTLTVGLVLRLIGSGGMMRSGGVIAAIGLLAILPDAPWPAYTVAFMALGFGFFMIHNSLQNRVTELAPTARGSAIALHYFFFFMGQAVGPLLFGVMLHALGLGAALVLSATVIAATGLLIAHLLWKVSGRDPI